VPGSAGSQFVPTFGQAQPGDVVFAALHGTTTAEIDHSAVITRVTGGGWNNIQVAQHSPPSRPYLSYWKQQDPETTVWICRPNAG
jgi:hypothetical protein